MLWLPFVRALSRRSFAPSLPSASSFPCTSPWRWPRTRTRETRRGTRRGTRRDLRANLPLLGRAPRLHRVDLPGQMRQPREQGPAAAGSPSRFIAAWTGFPQYSASRLERWRTISPARRCSRCLPACSGRCLVVLTSSFPQRLTLPPAVGTRARANSGAQAARIIIQGCLLAPPRVVVQLVQCHPLACTKSTAMLAIEPRGLAGRARARASTRGGLPPPKVSRTTRGSTCYRSCGPHWPMG